MAKVAEAWLEEEYFRIYHGKVDDRHILWECKAHSNMNSVGWEGGGISDLNRWEYLLINTDNREIGALESKPESVNAIDCEKA